MTSDYASFAKKGTLFNECWLRNLPKFDRFKPAILVWCKLISMSSFPFNTLIEILGVQFGRTGGFGSYMFGMSESVAKQMTIANNAENIKNPGVAWMIGFLFVVSFLGLFSVVPLRKVYYLGMCFGYPPSTPNFLFHKKMRYARYGWVSMSSFSCLTQPVNHLFMDRGVIKF